MAVGARHFVRLKVRLIRNSFRGQTWRLVGWLIGVTVGLVIGLLAMASLASSAVISRDGAFVTAVLVGSAVVGAWAVVPLLFFGVDETLDPARFALLPLPRSVLTRGMLAAAYVSAPVVVTLLATTGLAIAAGLRSGAGAAVAAAVGILAGLTLGIAASRALTSAFATLLRSRRARDLAAIVIALLASALGPTEWFLSSAAARGSLANALPLADVLAWTPLGAPYAWSFDVAAGRWGSAAARLAIVLASIGLLLWWWSRTIDAAMLAVDSGGVVSAKPMRGGVVATLLTRVTRPTIFGAVVARETRYWTRDVRRRASIISILMASALVPVALVLGARPDLSAGVAGAVGTAHVSSFGFGFATSMPGTMSGMLLGNQFGLDGTAFAAQLLASVAGRVELRARAVAIGMVALPVQALVVVAFSLLTRQAGQLPAALGLLAASFGIGVAVAALLSVLAPYPQPETTNPFATNSGGASAKGLLAFVAMVATLALSSPVVLAASYLGPLGVGGLALGAWGVLAIGLAYGGVAAWVGTLIAGDVLDRRGPEILAAVTPRR